MNIWQQTSLVMGRTPKAPPPPVQQRLAAAPIPFHPEVRHVGMGPSNQPGADALLRESLGWSAIATKAIADRIASLALTAFRTLRDGTEEQLDRSHPLSRVLRAGSQLHGPIQTQRLIAQYLVTVGEAYLLKVRGREIGIPVELWVMNAARIRPVPVGGVISSYVVVNGNGAEIRVPAEDMVRIWWPDPENIYGAEGLLGPQGTVVDTNKFADQTMRSHFESNAMPRGVIEAGAEAGAIDPDEAGRFREDWAQRYNRRVGSDRGVPAFLPAGFTLHELQALGGVTEIVPALQHWRDQVLMAFGVPRSILGDVVDANRAAAETNQYVFDTHTVKPIADVIAEALTLQLAVPDFGEDVRVGFAEFAPKDKEFDLKRTETELRVKLRSINEVREDMAEEPVEWGDLPVGTIGEAPYTGDEPEPMGPDDPNALGADEDGVPEDEDEPRARGTARVRVDPAHEWTRVLARERKWVPPFRRAMLEVLTVQERALQAELGRAMTERALEREPDAAEILRLIAATLSPARWRKLFDRKVERVRRAAYIATAGESLKMVGMTGAFELTPETAARLRRQADQFRELVSNTSVKRVSREVSEAMAQSIEAGESLSQRAKAIEKAVGKGFLTRRNEAKTIARTETLKTTQAAQLDGYETSGVVERKQWNTSRDDAVRDSHEIDGQVVDLHESFVLGDTERAAAPGVGAGGMPLSAANTINCRCFVTPVLEDA